MEIERTFWRPTRDTKNSNETGLNELAQFNQSAIDDHSNELIECSEDSNIVSIEQKQPNSGY